MTSLVQTLGTRIVGTVEEVSADRITVLVSPEAPQATALNTGIPTGFPRVNGYILIPNESGATVCIISSVSIQRLAFPKRSMQKDYELVDLPFPSRLMTLTPSGTLKDRSSGSNLSFKVQRGVDVFPSVGDAALLPDINQLRAIVEGEDRETAKRVRLGHCPTAGMAPVYVDPDKLFGRHMAVLGNTGAGKSCSVAGLVRWSIDAARKARQESGRQEGPNARFVVLDPNGEYASAFKDLNVRSFRVEPGENWKPLRVPAWLWNGEEWAAFTNAAPGIQRPLLFDALRRLRSDVGHPDKLETRVRGKIRRYSNRIKLAMQSGEHLQPGRREGVAEVLLNISRDFEALAREPGFNECDLLAIISNISEVAVSVEESARQIGRTKDDGSSWHNDFSEVELESVLTALQDGADAVSLIDEGSLLDEDTPRPFVVNELPDFVEALAAAHSGRDIVQFIDTLNLRIRSLLLRSRLTSVVQPDDSYSITLEGWLTEYIGATKAENGQIAVIDLSLVPHEVIHVVVSVLARMVFEALQRYRREEDHELPTTLILEEAHRFTHRELSDNDASPAGRACTRVFERIAREGRKFGLGLVLASQRPSEISPTVLSQCNTFLLHRIVNDRDQEIVRRLVPDGLGTLLRDLPSLPSRRAILLGWAAPAPVLVEIHEIPEHQRPHSPDPAFWRVWVGEEDRDIDWKKISQIWQGVDASSGGIGASGDSAPKGDVASETDHSQGEEDPEEDDWLPF